jgi:hypothetical protein
LVEDVSDLFKSWDDDEAPVDEAPVIDMDDPEPARLEHSASEEAHWDAA